MKIHHVLLGFGAPLIILGFVLIDLGSIPPWNKDNFVYVMGIMVLLLGIPICCLGILTYWKRRKEGLKPNQS